MQAQGPPGVGAPPPPPDPRGGPRYPYLVGRLRRKEITMEEATELFGLMQAMLRAPLVARPTVPPPPPTPSGALPPRPAGAAPPAAMLSDDVLLLGLLAAGVGTGLLAAASKRVAAALAPEATAAPRRPASGR